MVAVKTYAKPVTVALLSFLCTLFTPYMLQISRLDIIISYSVASVVLFTAYCVLFWHTGHLDLRAIGFAPLVLGFIFSACLIYGAELTLYGNIDFSNWKLPLAIVMIGLLFAALLAHLFAWLDHYNRKAVIRSSFAEKWLRCSYRWLLVWALLLLCWLPVFLAAYPGFFCYDAWSQWSQVHTAAFNTQHPPLHTLLLGGTIELVHFFTGSYNAGIAVYMWLQMMAMAGCFVFALRYMEKLRVRTWICIAGFFYFAFSPVVSMFVMCSTKDVLCAGIGIVFVIITVEMMRDKAAFFASKFFIARYVVTALLMMMLRNNVLYSFLLFLPLCVWLVGKQYRLRTAALLIGTTLLILLYTGPLFTLLHIAPGDSRNALNIPLQQMARVYKRAPKVYSEEDRQSLLALIDEWALEDYSPVCADRVRSQTHMEVLSKDYGKYLSLWIRTGIKAPFIYLNATLENTIQAWYPDRIIDGYLQTFPFLYPSGTSFFYAEVEEPGKADSKFPALYEILIDISRRTNAQRIPVFSLLLSVGAMSWLMALSIGYALHRHLHAVLPALLFVLCIWIGFFLGPIVLPRYYLLLFYLLPVFAAVLFHPDKIHA